VTLHRCISCRTSFFADQYLGHLCNPHPSTLAPWADPEDSWTILPDEIVEAVLLDDDYSEAQAHAVLNDLAESVRELHALTEQIEELEDELDEDPFFGDDEDEFPTVDHLIVGGLVLLAAAGLALGFTLRKIAGFLK
jgi:hypothetical protein